MRDRAAEQEALAALETGLLKLDKFDTEHHVFYENRWGHWHCHTIPCRGLKAWWNDSTARDEGAKKENTYFHGRFSRDAG
jgi:hypothetical protein